MKRSKKFNCILYIITFVTVILLNLSYAKSSLALTMAVEGLGDQYKSVGYINDGNQLYGSGTLIGDRWVLTAAHVIDAFGDGFGNVFSINGADYPIISGIVSPQWGWGGPGDSNDIGLFYLGESVTGVTLPTLYDGSLGYLVGEEATLVGYGITYPDDYSGVTADGTRRAGNNTVAYYYASSYLFEYGFGTIALPGDSGGSAWLDFGYGDILTGVHSTLSYPYFSLSVDVSQHIPFISEYVQDVSWGISSISQTPEPATMLLLGTGLVGVAGAARRKKKNQA